MYLVSDTNLTLGAVQAVTILSHPKRPRFKTKILTDNWLETVRFRKFIIRYSLVAGCFFPLGKEESSVGMARPFFARECSLSLNLLYCSSLEDGISTLGLGCITLLLERSREQTAVNGRNISERVKMGRVERGIIESLKLKVGKDL